jgi:hypothetical protein
MESIVQRVGVNAYAVSGDRHGSAMIIRATLLGVASDWPGTKEWMSSEADSRGYAGVELET